MPYDMYAAALCLDGPTLANLELLEGSSGEAEGSLLAALDTCASPGTPYPPFPPLCPLPLFPRSSTLPKHTLDLPVGTPDARGADFYIPTSDSQFRNFNHCGSL